MNENLVSALYYLGSIFVVLIVIGLIFWSYLKNSPNQFHTLFERAMKMVGSDPRVIFVSKLDRDIRALDEEIFRRECVQIENGAAISSSKSQRESLLRLRHNLRSDEGEKLTQSKD